VFMLAAALLGCSCAFPLQSAAPHLSRRAALAGAALALPTSASAVIAERVGVDGRLILTDASAATIDVRDAPPAVTSRCYLDLSIGGKPAGRLVVDLFGSVAPRAAENFRQLCTGEKGFGYAGSSFYTVLSGLTVQAGDIEGHASIYDDKPFAHDNYALKHNVAGLVSMVNSGKGGGSGMSDSRFLIQLPEDAGFLDGRYEAFGRVSEGMELVRRIESLPVKGSKNRPVDPVRIDAAGELQMSNVGEMQTSSVS